MNITIGFHLIVKGNAHNIADCLNSCRGLADFIVVGVDDREDSDETFNLIKGIENVYAYRDTWEDSFSISRNRALHTLLKLRPDLDYIGWMDGDDVWGTPAQGSISHEEVKRRLAEQKPDSVNNVYIYADDLASGNPNLSYMRLRLFAHTPGQSFPNYEWEGSAHESLVQKKSTGGPSLWWNDWILVHNREKDIDFSVKTGRNIEMLEKDLQKNPNNTRTMFYLGREYKDFGKYEKSIVTLTKYVNKSYFDLEKYQALLDIGHMYLWKEDFDSAEEIAKKAIEVSPRIAFAYTLLGEIYMKKDRPDLAKLEFAKSIYAPHGNVLFDYIPGRTYVPHRWLSVACLYSNDYENAQRHHMIAKKLAPMDTSIKYNDPWLLDESESFPTEYNEFSIINQIYTEGNYLNQEDFLISLFTTLDIENKESLFLSNQLLTINQKNVFLINDLIKSLEQFIDTINNIPEKPTIIFIKNFSDWVIKTVVAKYLTMFNHAKLYRKFDLYRKNSNIPQKEGIGILLIHMDK